VFERRTWIGSKRWGFWEEIARGAFARTLANGADVRFLVNHDPNFVLARTKAGTLRLAEDEVGLAVDADMADVTYARDLAVLLERGDVSQMSFAFVPVAWEYTEAEDGNDLYRITEVELFDVAAVTYPAYEDTDAGLRSRGFERLAERLGLDDDARRLILGGSDADVERALRGGSMTTVDVSTDTPTSPPPERMGTARPPAESTGIDSAALRHRAMRDRRMAMTLEM
jgi:HK97 family phage prohead protease